MANYNVDIGVKVRGEELKRFADQLKQTQKQVEGVNKFLDTFRKQNIRVNESISNLNSQLGKAKSTFQSATIGTKQQVQAAKDLLQANENLNKGLIQQQKLLDDLSGATARKSAADNKKLQEGLLKLEKGSTKELEKQFQTRKEFQDEFKDEISKVNKQRQEENKLLQKNVQQTKKSVAEEIKKKFSIMASQKTRKAAFQQSVRELELENRINNVLQKRKQLQARKATNEKALSNALIGGAFPLLFGQGLGASIGGATGGFAGGKMGGQFGFALSLVGTAVGSQFDRLAQQARELGEALRDPIKNLDLLTKAVGAANTPFGDTIATLKSLGLEGVAAEAVLEKFNKTFNTNKQSIQELGEESIRFTNELAKLGTAISLFIANPLADFLEIINDTLGNTTTKGIKREAGLEAFNLGLAKFAPGTPKALANIAAKSNFFGKTVDGQTFDEFRKGIESGIFERRMNEAGLGGQSGTRNFADEDLQRLIKERRDFELSAMEGQLQIEQQSLTLRSEDLDVLKKRMDLLKIVEKIKVKELVDTNILSKEQKAQHDFELQKLDIERQISEELLKQSIIMSDPMKAALVDLNKEMAKFNDMRFQAVEFSKAFGSAFQESFKGIVKGTMSVQDAFRNMFSRIADHFLDMAAQMMANSLQRNILGMFGGSLFGGGFNGLSLLDGMANPFSGPASTVSPFLGFANGGRPPVGKPSIVGERGPELFTPGVSGTITPNEMLGGSTNIVVNVDASGSSVEGDEDQGRELGRLISVAVQSEIIQQQRPGGLLA
nr:phage tape measure protein [uncultured Mediterranean phage uvMED]